MPSSHPYISGAGSVTAMILQLRKAFPATVTSETVKKLGLAPNNESYVINALQFISVIDEEGKKTDQAAKAFSLHNDEDFQKSFSEMIKASYHEIFDLHGEATWSLSKDELITFFRQADQTSAIIGGRQANVFTAFAALSGHGEIQVPKSKAPPKAKRSKAEAPKKPTQTASASTASAQTVRLEGPQGSDFSLNVKIEINIPAEATAETYDNIFSSIRKNLMDAK